ncbi:hypothetical protein RR47_GL001854 [Enterococcus columbae DSM 7374 = ATCC 51263]|nr:hypothetical protein RR47_GL001854 [Enterococcus columbae DSM 7374 = ATCC 51263]
MNQGWLFFELNLLKQVQRLPKESGMILFRTFCVYGCEAS